MTAMLLPDVGPDVRQVGRMDRVYLTAYVNVSDSQAPIGHRTQAWGPIVRG
jgi:hypothetical protein